MKAYAINSKYGNRVRVIELELEEKPKTYKVIESGIGFYGSVIRKEVVNKFIEEEEQVICSDLDFGLKVYEQGINKLIEEENERHARIVNRFSLLKNQLNIGIETR